MSSIHDIITPLFLATPCHGHPGWWNVRTVMSYGRNFGSPRTTGGARKIRYKAASEDEAVEKARAKYYSRF